MHDKEGKKLNRSFTVLLIGGASGTGKSSIALAMARHYGISVLEIDDIAEALKAVTTEETLPVLHYWEGGIDWQDVGVEGNVDWLVRVSRELAPAIRAVVDNHLDADVPVIIEGDFLEPAFAASFGEARVKSLFVQETETLQIVQNYQAREGGVEQDYRAGISAAYGAWLAEACKAQGLLIIPARPWDTALARAIAFLSDAK